MGARSVVQPDKPTKKKPHRIFKRHGTPSKVEKQFIAQFVADMPQSITPGQVTALARTMRRSKEVVRGMIEQAKENFVTAGEDYVSIHKRATEAALASGTDKGLEVATKSAAWALENLAFEGVRIIDKAKGDSGGSKIQIAIALGGLNVPVSTEVIDAEIEK